MKKIILLLAAAVALSACTINLGNGIKFGGAKVVRCDGEVKEQAYDLKDFESIVVKGQANVTFVQADSFLVSVKANEEVFEYLELDAVDGQLTIDTKDGVNILAKTFRVTINAPLLTDVKVAGAADLDMPGAYTSDKPLNIAVNGAGDFSLEGLTVPSMELVINGAGDLDIQNSTITELEVTVNGAGDVDIDSITADSVSVTVRGAGDVQISGTAGQADFHVAGAGSVDARSLKCENVTTAKHGAASIKL
ncbi:MAG: DUF2807 domain-containing protein [Bacteroidales bacterium]|nr:DUF2807 domain-containing protein [Bacteroidales bacterium]